MAPARINESPLSGEYDYIICGGGTTGCVVAGRLAEDTNATILLVEAGPDSKDIDAVHMAGLWSQNFDKETDWNIVTEPMKGVSNRQVKCSRGRFLGGSSNVNGTLCIRGAKQDYDDWGLEGWSGEEMFSCMARAETFHPTEAFKGAPKAHGTSGPLHTIPHELAPISLLVRDNMIEKSLPYHEDMFTTGDVPHGCGQVARTIYQGVRTTGADYVTKGNKRENITIATDTTVDRVIIDKQSGGLRATAVELISKDGTKSTVTANKEIIVSGGSYCSPAILVRSGIGAKDEVEKLGIESVVDLPGVGKNLMDHLLVFSFYEVSKDGLTSDKLVYHDPDALPNLMALWKEKKTGFLSTFPFGTFGYARLDERLKDSEVWNKATREAGRDPMGLTSQQPNVEFWNTELYGGPKQYDQFPADGKHTFAMCALLFNAQSRGTVTVKTKDPMENPVVDHNYLDSELDLEVLAEGCRFANEIVMEGKATKAIIKGSYPADLNHHRLVSRDDWKPHVKKYATTCYHPAGTCKMGRADDPLAVVDEQLRVRGVQGLRVADVSVMPIVNNGHTQMPAYGIGEKAADLIGAAA